MDELKKLIDDNKQMFDSAEPMAGHFDRFQSKLNQGDKKIIDLNWKSMLKVASVAILVILSGLYIKDQLFKFIPDVPVAQVNEEFNETEKYYISLVNQQIGQIEQMDNTLSEEQQLMLKNEMTNMDNMYKKLQNDLKAMPNDPRIMQAMLQHYQMKLEVLNRIINNLNNVQQLNYPNHESIEL